MFSTIIYPQDFIREVHGALPGDTEIEKLLESGSIYCIRVRLKGKTKLVRRWNRIFKRHLRNKKDPITESFMVC